MEIAKKQHLKGNMYHPRHVANAIILQNEDSSWFNKVKLDKQRLQKMLWFLNAWNLAIDEKPLFTEKFKTHKYGPILESLLYELKYYREPEIKSPLLEVCPVSGNGIHVTPPPIDENFWKLFNQVWLRYGKFSGLQLSALASEEGSPWEVLKKDNPYSFVDIPDDIICKFYQSKMK